MNAVGNAAEIARLANVALADIGLPPKVATNGKWGGAYADHPMAFRAAALAVVVGALVAGEWLKALTFALIIAAIALIIAKERLIVELEACNNDLAASNRELRRDLLTALRAWWNP